jgi:hypothetical protein
MKHHSQQIVISLRLDDARPAAFEQNVERFKHPHPMFTLDENPYNA